MELYFNDKKYILNKILYESVLNEEEELMSKLESDAKNNIENIVNDKNKLKKLLSVIGSNLKQTNDNQNTQDNTQSIKNLETILNIISLFSLN